MKKIGISQRFQFLQCDSFSQFHIIVQVIEDITLPFCSLINVKLNVNCFSEDEKNINFELNKH